MNQTQKHCTVCQRPTLHAKTEQPLGCGFQLLLTVLTLGLWLPLALLMIGGKSIANATAGYRCQVCGAGAAEARQHEAATGFSAGRVLGLLFAFVAGVVILAALAGN